MIDKGYRFKFKEEDFNSEVIEMTKFLISKFWTEDRNQEICNWLNYVSRELGVNTPRFTFDKTELCYGATGGGCYIPELDRIILFKKYSLTTLLHEYRHFLQHKTSIDTIGDLGDREETEEDARAWSCSLYFVCDPKRFNRAMSKGILHFV